MVEPVDISNAIVWLVSDDARYVTGVTRATREHEDIRQGPEPRPLAARLPRLDVLLDTSGEQDADLARLGHGRMLLAHTYRDIAPALATLFTGLAVAASSGPDQARPR